MIIKMINHIANSVINDNNNNYKICVCQLLRQLSQKMGPITYQI